MTFDLRLRRVSYLTAVLGMLALGLAEMNVVYLALIVLVAVVGWIREDAPDRVFLGPITLNLVILLALGYAALDYVAISQSWILSLAHFLLIVQMAKLLLPKTDRDYAQVYLISLMNVAVAAIVTVNVFFAISFVLYSGTVLFGLILLHFHREIAQSRTTYLPSGSEAVRPTVSPDMHSVASNRFSRMLLTLVLIAWVCNVGFFLFVPRFQAGFIRFNPGSLLNRLTGFSENVRLGEIGRILRNETPVMHVQLKDRQGTVLSGPRDLYWRGLTYQHYDGREWHTVGPDLKGSSPIRPRNFPYVLDMLSAERLRRMPWVEQNITLEPMGSQTFFALPGLLAMQCPGLIRVDKNYLDETYRTSVPLRQVTRYTALSDVSDPSRGVPSDLLPHRGELSGPWRDAYLQLPRDISDRMKELARQISPPAERQAPRECARRVEQYLKDNFGYTLDLKPNPDVEPVEDFLFNRKEGHCEYFASSMVLLLRCLGIPGRLVSGFRGGEWNDLGEWYVVRQSDAHAWVEAYLDGEGWARFDPTPAASRRSGMAGLALGPMDRWLDYLRTTWLNHVVQYDEEQQSVILQHTRNASRRFRLALGNVLVVIGRPFKNVFTILTDVQRLTTQEGLLTLAGVVVPSTGIVLLMRWLLLRMGRRAGRALARRRARRLGRAHVAFYQELQRVLKRRGFERTPATTPREFSRQVATVMESMRPALEELTDVFYGVRFGRAPLQAEEERRLRALIESFRSAPISPPR